MQKMQETEVQPLGQEDALEEGMATHSIILAWEIPWTEEPGGLQFTGSQVDMTEYAHTHMPSTVPSKDGWVCGWGTPCKSTGGAGGQL